MRLWIRSLPEKIDAGERIVCLAFSHPEMRSALKAALPGNAAVRFSADEITISAPRRQPLILSRERRRWGRWGSKHWRMGEHAGEILVCGLAKLLRLPVPMMADRLIDAAGWRQ